MTHLFLKRKFEKCLVNSALFRIFETLCVGFRMTIKCVKMCFILTIFEIFMKKLCLYASVIIILMACNNMHPGSFKLDGFIEGTKDAEKVMLSYYSLKNGEWYKTVDTAEIRNGKFVFTGHMDELTAADLFYEEGANFSVRLYLEPTAMRLLINKDKPYAYVLMGTKVEKENIELRKELEPYEKFVHEYFSHVGNLLARIQLHYDNMPVRDSLYNELNLHREKMRSVGPKILETRLGFISKHNTYRIVPDLLLDFPADTAKSIYNSLPEQSKSSLLGKLAYKRVEYKDEYEKSNQEFEANSLVGRTAPDFTRQDVYGNTVRLSDFKNRNFVLLDFWASWCLPCIENIPQITNVYDQYGKQGLTIIGISLDADSTQWLNAVDTHQLDQWPQILSIENEKPFVVDYEQIGNLYYVTKIPCFILIDKQGKIAARWEASICEEQFIEIEELLQ